MTRIICISLTIITAAASNAVIYDELEPNDTFATANNTGLLMPGDQIRGRVRGQGPTPDIDFWNLNVANEAPGQIYEYSLRYNTEVNGIPERQDHYVATWDTRPPFEHHGMVLRGTSQISNPTKFRFYSFGVNGSLQYHIHDTVTTGSASDYDLFWDRSIVSPTDLGTYSPGQFRFDGTRRLTNSSETTLVLLNRMGRLVPGAARYANGQTLFDMTVNLEPGTYFVMLSGDIASDEVYALPWVLRNSQFKVGLAGAYRDPLSPYAVTLTTAGMTHAINYEAELATKGRSGIFFGKITVVPEPTSVSTLILGLGALIARRRSQK